MWHSFWLWFYNNSPTVLSVTNIIYTAAAIVAAVFAAGAYLKAREQAASALRQAVAAEAQSVTAAAVAEQQKKQLEEERSLQRKARLAEYARRAADEDARLPQFMLFYNMDLVNAERFVHGYVRGQSPASDIHISCGKTEVFAQFSVRQEKIDFRVNARDLEEEGVLIRFISSEGSRWPIHQEWCADGTLQQTGAEAKRPYALD